MATKLIRLQDGILVEVEVLENQVEAISGGLAKKVERTFDEIRPVLIKVGDSIVDVWKGLQDSIEIDQTEIEIGFSFEAEGNVYIAKSAIGANILVRLHVKNKNATK